MSQSMTGLEDVSGHAAPVAPSHTEPLYWSVRRELWEHTYVLIAPFAVAGVILFATMLANLAILPHRMRSFATLSGPKQHEVLAGPFTAIVGTALMTAFLVGVFYSLDALYGERRDRSILLWKSLPISDRTTVLAKIAVPFVILPLLVIGIVLTSQLILFLFSSVVVLFSGNSVATYWTHLPLLQMWVGFLCGVVAFTLWYAPVYAWMLLVSSWARRAAILWAILPFLALAAIEKGALGTNYVMNTLGFRMTGWMHRMFAFKAPGSDPRNPLTMLTPGRFLLTPGLWIGLVLAALFILATIRVRRAREPL